MRRKRNPLLKQYLLDYPDKTIKEMLDKVNEEFNESYTLKELRLFYIRNKIPYKYETEKRSHANKKERALYSELVNKDGRTLIKVGKRKWIYKKRYLYEKYYNVKLKSDDFIVCIDGNELNLDKSNLKLVNRRILSSMQKTKTNEYKGELKDLSIELAKLRLKIKDMEVE